MDRDERLQRIRSKGYWRVVIRPTRFERERIRSLAECKEVVRSSVVALRGWDYPHFGKGETSNGAEWVESGSDFVGHVEYWRFHQSAQFVHLFACKEDYNVEAIEGRGLMGLSPSANHRYLHIPLTVYKFTEIFEFASRLASKDVLWPEVSISVALENTDGRQLFFWDPWRTLYGEYICNVPRIERKGTFAIDDLTANAAELALDGAAYVFERFNWDRVPRSILAEDQKKLLERRL